MKRKPLSQNQASRLLRNRMPATTHSVEQGFTGGELRALLKQWGVPRRRRGGILQRMVLRGELVRHELEEPVEVDGRQVHYLFTLPRAEAEDAE